MLRTAARALREPRILVRSARIAVADPVEAVYSLREMLAEREESRGHGRDDVASFMPWPPCPFAVDADWEERLHELIGAPWPCPAADEFRELWPEVTGPFMEGRFGRGAFAGWGDGEPGLVRAVWCICHHLKPATIVETGVARGITSRFILEALHRNNNGHLWSIDLPPPLSPELHEQIGMAVPERLGERWTYVRGSSRRRLPRLLAAQGPIDLFIHDSRHSARNLTFELESAWGALKPGGLVVADDVDLSCALHAFQDAHRPGASLICPAEPLEPDVGRQGDTGVFAILRKGSG